MSPRSRPESQPEVPGFLELPPGKIAAVATYLEMKQPPREVPPRSQLGAFQRIARDLPRYRRLFAEVGQPWLWFSRALLSDAQLGKIIAHPDVEAFAFVIGGADAGILELDFRKPGECELAFLGLVPGAVGRGLGRELAGEAIRRAFARPISRLWLHTCTLDHPAAVRFYRSVGFSPYRRALEVADDPRLTGRLPRGAAPEIPII
ncbi:MAG: family acetyltransferase [Enterovirga sp.]|jgi:ribosomal protein S18 acetylase RimI-like enzyme|nr:family acetyltransferase [Enterovirga sp.]